MSSDKGTKGTVLVVDDVEENRVILTYYLEKAGFSVRALSNGISAVVSLENAAHAYDLVLMDMQMPKMDGYSAVRKLRSQGFKTPIVAVTAHTLTGDREKCLMAGCDAYLGKPVEPELLVSTCLELVEQSRSRAA